MTQLLIYQLLLTLLFTSGLATGFCISLWITRGKKSATEAVADMSLDKKIVDNSVSPPAAADIREKRVPKSTVTKFPDAAVVRKQKEVENTQAFIEDWQKNKRPSGSFAL